jgi:hypothetical protein
VKIKDRANFVLFEELLYGRKVGEKRSTIGIHRKADCLVLHENCKSKQMTDIIA